MKQIVASLLLFGANAMAASWTQTTLGSHDGTTRVAMSLDGTTAASTGAKTVKIWHVATGKLLRTWQTEHDGVSLAFTPDGKGLAIRNERGVDLLDVSTGQILRTFNVQTGGVPRVAISRDGRWLAAGASDHKARVWDLASGKLMHELPHQYHLVFGVHFTADSKAIATGSGDGVATHGEVKLWDLET